MIDEMNPKFLEFLEIYERFHALPSGEVKPQNFDSVSLDREAEGLLDDLKFLLTHENRHQEKTRKDLRRFIGKLAHDRIKVEIK